MRNTTLQDLLLEPAHALTGLRSKVSEILS